MFWRTRQPMPQQIFLMLQKQHPGLQSLDFQIRAAQLQSPENKQICCRMCKCGGYIADGDPMAGGKLRHSRVRRFCSAVSLGAARNLKRSGCRIHSRSGIPQPVAKRRKLANEISKLNEIMDLQREQLAISLGTEPKAITKPVCYHVEISGCPAAMAGKPLQLQNSATATATTDDRNFPATGNYLHIAQLQGE